ncbi:MAG: cytochrome C [Bacteroidales bacterium]|nr:cytochrome C [Bacteroidales bacterium]
MLIKRILFTTIFAFLLGNFAFAQISPGELSKGHADLEGVSNCTKCHTVGNKVTREKCLACHKEIKAQIVAKKGFHASSEVGSKDCFTCHNEHHGRNFQIVKFDQKKFDHNLTGFKLSGVHAKKDCKACHKAEFISDPKLKKNLNTFLGLKQECLSCHADYHQGKLSNKCATCHGFESFKNPKVVGFDHNKTKFPLLGKHKTTDCVKCHKTEIIDGKPAQRFKGLKFASCVDCHKDVHENKFGQDCKKCHTEESFHIIKNEKTFDHDKTNFKLIGAHNTVDCKKCHKSGKMTDPLKHNRCSDCHTDYHKGEFAKNGISPDCNQCHTNDSFKETNYTIESHNKTKFKLEGAHMATACIACHKKEDKWSFKNMGTKCVDCHKNEHKGFIQDKYFAGENCTVCHTVNSWKEVKFDHNKTNFKLEGVHAKESCSACHYAKNDKGIKVQKFKGLAMDCSACHKDSHRNQFAENGKTDCTRCHNFDKWEDSKFDHNTSRFLLEGEHKNVKCIECHKPATDQKGKYIQYKFNNIECSSCHS